MVITCNEVEYGHYMQCMRWNMVITSNEVEYGHYMQCMMQAPNSRDCTKVTFRELGTASVGPSAYNPCCMSLLIVISL